MALTTSQKNLLRVHRNAKRRTERALQKRGLTLLEKRGLQLDRVQTNKEINLIKAQGRRQTDFS